jgi:hypothetical protein
MLGNLTSNFYGYPLGLWVWNRDINHFKAGTTPEVLKIPAVRLRVRALTLPLASRMGSTITRNYAYLMPQLVYS